MMREKRAGEHSTKIVTVAYPGQGMDAALEIRAAIEEAKNEDGFVEIRFETGKIYEVWPESAYHARGYYITNTAGKLENPDGERWSAILMKDMKNVVINGSGALLLVHGVMTPILIDGCENIIFRNFNLDYARPTVSEYTVTMKTDTYIRIKVHKDSLYRLRDTDGDGRPDSILWQGERTLADGEARYWENAACLLQELDPDRGTLRRVPWYGYGSGITDLGDNVLQLEFPEGSRYREGCTYQARDGIRNQVGVFIHRSKNVTFEDCGFHYMHGLGVVGQYTENLTLHRLECAPRPETGRTCASFADFVQMSGCRGEILIADSHFSGAHDDTVNIHGTHLRIVEADRAERRLTVRFMHEQSWGFQAFEAGDEIELIDGESLVPYHGNVVKDFIRKNDTDIELMLEEALPEGIRTGCDAVENVTWTPNVTIRNNLSEYVPTRGILCTTRGKVVIEKNVFRKHGMAAILLEDDARGWFESGLIRDMTIRDNLFEDGEAPQIHSNPQVATADPEKTVHSNIAVTGNRLTGQAVEIRAVGTKGFRVEDNIFPEAGGKVFLTGCNGFAVRNNENQTGIYQDGWAAPVS